MPDHKDLWDAYMRAFSTTAAETRRELLERCVADDVVFTNPGGEGRTREALLSHIEGFQTKMPGCEFATERLYHNHGELLAVWTMRKGGAEIAKGYNFVRLATDGRFAHMSGFF